jgi:hypothetical protein
VVDVRQCVVTESAGGVGQLQLFGLAEGPPLTVLSHPTQLRRPVPEPATALNPGCPSGLCALQPIPNTTIVKSLSKHTLSPLTTGLSSRHTNSNAQSAANMSAAVHVQDRVSASLVAFTFCE